MTPPDDEYLRKSLKDSSGLDLSSDKQDLIESRLLPVAHKAALSRASEIVRKMKGGSPITSQMVEAMTTNETFFLDVTRFDRFRKPFAARAGR